MRKAFLISLLFVISAVCLQAQSAAPTTLQGCLQYTGGHYRLTASDGMSYQLQSEANKLQKLVGHQVEITGTQTVRTVDTTQQGTEASANEHKVFKWKTVKSTADTCSAPAK